jgi:hypothetical protein
MDYVQVRGFGVTFVGAKSFFESDLRSFLFNSRFEIVSNLLNLTGIITVIKLLDHFFGLLLTFFSTLHEIKFGTIPPNY